MSRAHRPGRTFFSFPDAAPYEERWFWESPIFDMGAFLRVIRQPIGNLSPFAESALFGNPNPQWRDLEPAAFNWRVLTVPVRAHYYAYDEATPGFAWGLCGAAARVTGDDESGVEPGTIRELVALAKAGQREDFDFLAGACGVEDRESLWTGTRARLHLGEAKQS